MGSIKSDGLGRTAALHLSEYNVHTEVGVSGFYLEEFLNQICSIYLKFWYTQFFNFTFRHNMTLFEGYLLDWKKFAPVKRTILLSSDKNY